MNLYLLLGLIGAAEALVYLWRYRSATKKGVLSSAMSSGAVQLLRVSGIGGVAYSVGEGVWGPLVIYVVVPVVVTAFAHAWCERSRGGE